MQLVALTEQNFVLLLKVKMPTMVGILTFISRINATSERFQARQICKFQHFTFHEQVKYHAQFNIEA